MQNKKALVLAVSAALAIPCAFAQKGEEPDSVVVLYGKAYPEIVRPSGKGATAASTACSSTTLATRIASCDVATFAAAPTGTTGIIRRNEMESSNSRLGVRGHEKLGGDLKAIFQLETQFLVDQNTTNFAQRDSFVGLQHKRWGTIKLGRFDTPFKDYGDDISFLGVSSGNFTSTSSVLRRPGFGGSNASRFHERRINSIQYESPDWGPLEFKVMYSTDESDTPTRKPHVWSAGGSWEFGIFEILVGYEIHYDQFGGSRNMPISSMANTSDQSVRSRDKAAEIALKVKLGRHQFEFDANQKKYDETGTAVAGRFRSYKNNSFLALWDARWSQQWRTQIHWVKGTAGTCSLIGFDCSTTGLGGTQTSAGVAYYFSRRTYLFYMASWVKNDFSAQFNTSNAQNVSVGEDLFQHAIGIHHSF